MTGQCRLPYSEYRIVPVACVTWARLVHLRASDSECEQVFTFTGIVRMGQVGTCEFDQDADSAREALRRYIHEVEEEVAVLLGAANSKRTGARNGPVREDANRQAYRSPGLGMR